MIDPNDRAERDADLLDGAYTPAVARLSATLDKAYAATPPPHLDAVMLRALHERGAVPRRPASRRWYRRPAVVLGLALLGVALLAGAVFATSLIEQAFELNQGAADVYTLSSPINLSQSVCGYSMTVQRAYADANNVIVAYTLTAPLGRTFIASYTGDPTLDTAQGAALPQVTGADVGGWQGGGDAHIVDFDASAIAGAPTQLRLRLTPPTIRMLEKWDGTEPAAQSCETTEPVPASWVIPAPWQTADRSKMRLVSVKGLAPIDFTAPFSVGRRLDLRQTVETGGHALTLERVVATASATRLYLRGESPGDLTTIDLTVDGHTIAEHLGWSQGGLSVHGFDPIDAAYKEATATVQAQQGGLWTFHFTLP